ncbi:MAG: peptidylprolyl isomerase [Rikenellaceae bacterium]
MTKRTLLPLLLIASAIIVVAQPRKVMLDKVVAVVGGSSILHSQVSEYASMVVEQRRQYGYTSDRDPMNEALEALLTQSLLYNQALLDSVEINTTEIALNVEQIVSQMADEAGGIRELEKRENMAIFNIKSSMRQKYEEQYYAQTLRQEVMNKVKVIPGEVEHFYNTKSQDSLPLIGEQYVYAHITRFPESIEEAKRRVRTRLLEMRQRVISGDTRFDALARMYSVDPGSAYRGGEMEPQASNAFVEPFAEAIEQLQVGQVSEVVETEFGFHIIELIDKRGNLYHCRHILLRPVFTYDELAEPNKFLDSLAGQIVADSITFELAAKLYSDDKSSKMNGGIVSNQDLLERYNMGSDTKLTVTKFLKEDFGSRGYKSIDDYMALKDMKVGEISKAFATEDLVGNKLSKIVKLVDIIPAHRASLANDYLRIEEMALVDKQDKVFEEWFSKRIDAMYVYIDPEYRSDEFVNKHWLK